MLLPICPGHKIPALVDHDGPGGQRISLCESGAILKYLGEKANNGLWPTDPVARLKAEQWLFWGSATFTTLAQQFGHWVKRSPEVVPPARAWYTDVLKDMFATMDKHLSENEYFAGKFTMADVSMYADTHLHGVQDVGLAAYPHVKRWHDAIEARPAVKRAWGPH